MFCNEDFTIDTSKKARPRKRKSRPMSTRAAVHWGVWGGAVFWATLLTLGGVAAGDSEHLGLWLFRILFMGCCGYLGLFIVRTFFWFFGGINCWVDKQWYDADKRKL